MKTPYILDNIDIGKINAMLDIIERKSGRKLPRMTTAGDMKKVFEFIKKELKTNINTEVKSNDIYGLNKNFQLIFQQTR